MTFQIVRIPALMQPVYNPMIYSVNSTNWNEPGFRYTSDIFLNGSKIPNARYNTSEYVTNTVSTLTKAPTFNQSQYWDSSDIAQSFLSYNFTGDTRFITPSGNNTVAFLENTLSDKTFALDKSVGAITIGTFIFNGGEDRNDFKINEEFDTYFYKYLPVYAQLIGGSGNFLTHFNTREVTLEDTGTLACFNGVFSGKSAPEVTCDTDAFDITTYVGGAVSGEWTYPNKYRNDENTYDYLGDTVRSTRNARITIPAYPKNLKQYAPWCFDDNFFTGDFGMISTEPHNFEVGDEIYVYQDPGYIHGDYNGLTTVTRIISPYIIETDKPWLGNTPANGGSVVTKSTVLKVDDTILNVTGVTNNAGFPEFHFDTNIEDISPFAEIVTSGMTNYNLNDNRFIAILNNPNSCVVITALNGNDTGKALIRTRMPLSSEKFLVDNTSYNIQFSKYSADTLTYITYGRGATFNIVNRCSKDKRIELFWLNKLGAFDSILTHQQNTKTIEFNKESYGKRLGEFVRDKRGTGFHGYNYSTMDFEQQNFNGNQKTKYTVTTDFLTEEEGERIIECMGSNVVFMYENGVFTPVVTTIEDVTVKTKRNNKLINYLISLDLTYNRLSQRR